VTGESPAASASGVAAGTAVSVTFSEPVQPAALSFVLSDASGNAVAAAVRYNAATYTATLTPASPLAVSATYTATVSGATDLSGNAMTAPFSWSFTTSSDLVAAGTAYRWSGLSSATSNTNRAAAAGLIDGNLTTNVPLSGGSDDVANAYEAAGVVWAAPQSIGEVVFVNGSFNASSYDGVFDNNFGLQVTTDGNTWTSVSGWSLSPAYAYNSASAASVSYTFTGPALSVLGVRVVGQVHSISSGSDSWYENAAEVQAFTPAPAVQQAIFSDAAPQSLSFTFGQPITAGISSLRLQNLTSGRDISADTYGFDAGVATFGFNNLLPTGNYRATLLASGVIDSTGQHPSTDYTFDFFFLLGDVNHDRTVDFSDVLLLAQNYGTNSANAPVDLNGDGQVDFADLLILAQNYGQTLPPAATGAAQTPAGQQTQVTPTRKLTGKRLPLLPSPR
jgi:methionine-rich copper-binding protein CopC